MKKWVKAISTRENEIQICLAYRNLSLKHQEQLQVDKANYQRNKTVNKLPHVWGHEKESPEA